MANRVNNTKPNMLETGLTLGPLGYDRKGLYQTGTGNRIFNSAIPVLLTGTGFFFWLSGSGLSGTGILKSHSGSG